MSKLRLCCVLFDVAHMELVSATLNQRFEGVCIYTFHFSREIATGLLQPENRLKAMREVPLANFVGNEAGLFRFESADDTACWDLLNRTFAVEFEPARALHQLVAYPTTLDAATRMLNFFEEVRPVTRHPGYSVGGGNRPVSIDQHPH